MFELIVLSLNLNKLIYLELKFTFNNDLKHKVFESF